MPSLRHLLLLLVAAAMPVEATAGVLVLKNGDRITGTIKKIWDAEVAIEPSYAGEFTVDMDMIESIESDREFESTLADGREVVAQPAGADESGKQQLVIEQRTEAVALDALSELEEIDEYFTWEANADWSSALNSGNTDSINNRLAANALVEIGDHRHLGQAEFIREQQNSETTKQQDILRYNYNWLFSDPWFLGGGISFERDPIRELERRSILSAGIGRDLFNTPRLRLNFQLGAGRITEELAGQSDISTVANWQLRYRQDFFSEDLQVFHNHSISHYVRGRDNTIYNTSTGVRYDINDLLYANVQLDYNYETNVAQGTNNEDIALLFGIGVEL